MEKWSNGKWKPEEGEDKLEIKEGIGKKRREMEETREEIEKIVEEEER